ncbi:hypothetical protein PMPD1_0742 [Paramixta manurensis]|uniref:RHS protein conserved region domain-containing protein n=1 Tax=Paramixta manurensis TaxID=2740817 RepID=A0A6M8U887_9GAMM|nr:hypothetical protein PMPD1_0742 [Erwiniaceae bacterium PD-1]
MQVGILRSLFKRPHCAVGGDPLERRISKSRWQAQHGQRQGRVRTTRFVWEGMRLLQEIHDEVPLTYVYTDQGSYEPLARIDGVSQPEIYWFHCAPNGMPERLTDAEGEVRWHGHNSAWGKLLREERLNGPGYAQNQRMLGQYLDRDKFVWNKFEQRISAGPEGVSLMDEASIPGYITIYSVITTRTVGASRSRTR